MPHISFSELKNWTTCPFYHKLTYIDKIKAFQGNEHTAFGTALHEVCEKTIQHSKKSPTELFLDFFDREIKSLSHVDMKKSLIREMRVQGTQLAPLAIPALKEHFGDYSVISVEEQLYEGIGEFTDAEFNFKGYIDLVIQASDGKFHIIDWKTCSWGWDSRRKNEKMTTYQLTFYKHYWALKHDVDPALIETHFALLKRTAKTNKVEIFRVTSGAKKTNNAIKLLTKALYNIHKENHIKNRLSCKSRWGYCEFYKTEHCP